MEQIAIPWLFMGPAGSGKMVEARSIIAKAHKATMPSPLETQILPVGDGYEARIFTSPYHFEIDIPNLSMQDKQIIGDLLTTFFSSTDVFHALRSSSRKLVIMRRAHSLSLPAAIRVRAILQQYVFPPDAVGMIWMTAREMTGPLALLLDGFCVRRIPRRVYEDWKSHVPAAYHTSEAYEACEGRVDRGNALATFFPTGTSTYPRRIQDYYDELFSTMIRHGRSGAPPTLAVISWLRSCVYQMLSFCQTGPEIVDSCAAAVERAFLREPHEVFWDIMTSLTMAEPHTSYRTPLSLEMMLLRLYEVLRERMSVVALAPDSAPTPIVEKRIVKKRVLKNPRKAKNEVVVTTVKSAE